MDLLEWFHIYNRRYFRFSKKKMATLLGVEWKRMPDDTGFGCLRNYIRHGTGEEGWKILINSKYKWSEVICHSTLLHEMVHFKLTGRRIKPHGRVFNAEMKTLAAKGAFNPMW